MFLWDFNLCGVSLPRDPSTWLRIGLAEGFKESLPKKVRGEGSGEIPFIA